MSMHQPKPKRVRFSFDRSFFFEFQIDFRSECAALVKQGKVYGVGTEDMDVNNRINLFISIRSVVFRL